MVACLIDDCYGRSAGLPDEDGEDIVGVDCVMEVEHVLVFKTDLAPEVSADYALPSWVEHVVKDLLEFLCQRHVDVLRL